MVIKLDLSYLTKRRVSDFLSVFNNVKSSLQEVKDVPVKKSRIKAFIEIKKHANLAALDTDVLTIKNGDKKYSIVSETPYKLRIVERGIKSKHIERVLSLNNGNVVEAEGFKAKQKMPDDYLNEVLELFDVSLFRLRRLFANPKFVEFMNIH